jgi:hypothetical protein
METMELVDFLRARLDEDEETALGASPGGWHYGTVDSVAGGALYDTTRTIANVVYEQRGDHDGRIVRHLLEAEADRNGAHIERHDPARVLADVGAKRRILEMHESWPVLVERPPVMKFADGVENLAVSMSQQVAWLTTKEYRARFGDEPPTSLILRALALPYADHPDYDESWRP